MISGRLMASIGVKGVTILSLVLTAVSLLIAVLVTDIWLLTLSFGLVSGVATGLVASVLGRPSRTAGSSTDGGSSSASSGRARVPGSSSSFRF